MTHPPPIVCVAGFADNAAMYAPLLEALGPDDPFLHPINLPGFGAPPAGTATIAALAKHLHGVARGLGARTVLAHSVASVIAAEAAHLSESTIEQIVSLEGNLTAEDAYFSGTAADHPDPESFRTAFLERLREMARDDPILQGYCERAATADPHAMWELGRDARRYSDTCHPGERLRNSSTVTYVLNRANCSEASLQWLDRSGLYVRELPGASHWPSIDRTADVLAILRGAKGSS